MVARWAHNPKVVRSNRASATLQGEAFASPFSLPSSINIPLSLVQIKEKTYFCTHIYPMCNEDLWLYQRLELN